MSLFYSLHRVARWLVPDVAGATLSFETSGTNHPETGRHNP